MRRLRIVLGALFLIIIINAPALPAEKYDPVIVGNEKAFDVCVSLRRTRNDESISRAYDNCKTSILTAYNETLIRPCYQMMADAGAAIGGWRWCKVHELDNYHHGAH